MTRTLGTPRSLLALFCGLVGALLLAGAAASGRTDAGRSQVTALALPHAGEEAADQSSSREAAALARRGAHLSKVGVERWHREGFRGKGVKVAVLDSGFRGWRDHLGKSLPEKVTVKSFRADADLEARDSQHGILCGEVVHALAPDAELLFANWEADSPQSFLDAMRWAREQGARVISCSVIMPSWSDGEGGGPVHDELARILGGERPDDVLCFASAGNTAKRTWSGTFEKGADGFHEWRNGVTANPLTPWGGERVSVEVCWRGEADFEVRVEDAAGKLVASSPAADGERHSTQARFEPDASRSYRVRVRQLSGKPSAFHCVALASGLEFSRQSGSVCFPADGPEVIAVGAVDEEGRRMTYSSCGPNSTKPKPDLVATVPFPSLWREKPFSGTSAASPQAAALAALWRSRHPDWPAAKIREAMCKSARDLGEPGHDSETGYGLIQLPSE
jgi:subtilisin family serine protease